MSNLHAYFALRNLQGFTKALDGTRSQTSTLASGPTLSSSGGKSWTRTNAFTSSGSQIDVNARDWLGRTILHIACASSEPFTLAYVRLLLAHPNINVNLQDTESRWTALHRALYAGNIAASQLLMQRPDIDVELRDNEGLTAFDLYNSTVDGTGSSIPETLSVRDALKDRLASDLFTWGGNRNAALGHGDNGDRTYPDQVVIKNSIVPETTSDKLSPIQVRGVSMSKLHTTVITTEKRGNLRACGFGSGGRLGPGQHTQYSLLPVPQFNYHIVAIALGQDHTVALTSDGEVLSWGLNRFSQLGYVVEPSPTPSGSLHPRAREEPIQAVARKVVGPLKKQTVLGVAACKTASACWTRSDVYTWGTNHGQLGYDKIAQPVQVVPRKVTGVQAVTDLAMTDSAMACLLETRDVICFTDDTRFRVKFPTPELSDFSPYVPPFIVRPPITKLTSCDDTFAALSSRGDVFTFSVSLIPTEHTTDRVERGAVKPQRVWSMRKSLNPARDVALGWDGELILCTESGHVFVRSRNSKGSTSGKALKFHRVPFIHRAIKVCANTTGAYGALRLNYSPKPVSVSGPTLMDDLKGVRPWQTTVDVRLSVYLADDEDLDDGEALEEDVIETSRLCSILTAENVGQKPEGGGPSPVHGRLAHGADVIIQAGLDLPAHRVILSSRCPILRDLVEGRKAIIPDGAITINYRGNETQFPRLVVTGCHPMTVLLFLEYLYSDDFPALWDRRVLVPCGHLFKPLKLNPMQVKVELVTLARILNLPTLSEALSASVKRILSPTISSDMHHLFHEVLPSMSTVKPDVFLELADKVVPCHSVILRARCPFFRSFFDDEEWTTNRWSPAGTISVDMKHLEWRAVSFAIVWLYDGNDTGMFDHLGDSVETVPDFLDTVFAVMAVASEFLLDKLMLICSVAILRHVNLTNVVSVLAEATYYNALPLVSSLQDYVACNLEAIMESHFIDGMQPDLIMALSGFIRSRQAEKSPIMRSNMIAEKALRKAASWLELQDLPQPLIRGRWTVKDSPKLDPVTADQLTSLRRASVSVVSPLPSPSLRATVRQSPSLTPKPSHGDDIFPMDDFPVDTIPALHIGQPQTLPTNFTVVAQAWKSKSPHVPSKVNMKTIIAETAARTSQSSVGSPTSVVGTADIPDVAPSTSPKSFQKPSQRQRRRMDGQSPLVGSDPIQQVVGSGLPWKLPDRPAPAPASPVSVSVRVSRSDGSTRAIHPSPSTPRVAPQLSKAAIPTPVIPVAGSSSRSDAFPELVPRRSHADAPAWTAMSVADSAAPSQMSFATIQQQQREQVPQSKGKRSLREIQEEEQAKQEEEDFLKWWAAEEQRLKAEGDVADARHCHLINSSSRCEQKVGRRGTRTFRDDRGGNRQ